MGAYLSEPVTTKVSSDKCDEKLSYGVSGMQGWRVSMEDSHTCILDYDDDTSFFAVYDGHGGSEVATYTAEHLPNYLKTVNEYKNGDLKECLVNGFLEFDKHLLDDEVMSQLRNLAGMNSVEEGENELESLALDAEIPIEELMMKLKEGGYNVPDADKELDPTEKQKKGESSNKGSSGTTKDDSSIRKNEGKGSKGKGKKVENDESRQQEVKEENGKLEETNKVGEAKEEKAKLIENVDEEKPEKSKDNEGEGEEEEDEEEEDESEEESEEEEDDDDDDDNERPLGDGDEVCYDSGTTAIVALLRKSRLLVANVGDSRCVLCRNGVAIDMSQDHKPEDDKELTRIKNAGGRVTGEGRVNGGLNLSRALGDHRYKATSHLGADEQQITAMPDVKETEITEADKFLVLACDGIWNVLSSQEVVDFVTERLQKQAENDKISLSKICEELFDKCLASDTSGDGSGCDNMTAIIVLLSEDFSSKKNKRKLEEQQIEEGDEKSTKKPRTD